jgi:hypothetical protein
MTKYCLNCGKPVEQVTGKRAKLYCDALCKANYFKKKPVLKTMVGIDLKEEIDRLVEKYSNLNIAYEFPKLLDPKSDMVSISREEYERLKAAASSWNNRMSAISEAIKNSPPSIVTSTSDLQPVLAPIIEKEGKRTGKKVIGKASDTAAPLIESVVKKEYNPNNNPRFINKLK